MDSSTIINDDIFLSERLVRFINRVRNSEISSIQQIVSGILEATGNPDTCTRKLKELITIDPPLSAAVLKTANSALFSPRGGVADISQAIIRLGFKTITEIALSQKICQIFREGNSPLNRMELWINSAGTAVMTREIARKEFGNTGADLYAAGLLHRLGMVVMDQYLHQEYEEIIGKSDSDINIRKAEIDIAGFGHSEVGAALAEAWNFPLELVVYLGYYYDPFKVPEKYRRDLMILYVADFYCRKAELGLSGRFYCSTGGDKLYIKCLEQLGIEETNLELLMPAVEEEVKVLSDMGQ